jgi:hypothetical protein
MLRGFVILLAIAYAVLPPGLCQCRLEAMLLPASDLDHCAGEEPNDHCDCPQLKEDGLPPPQFELPATECQGCPLSASAAPSVSTSWTLTTDCFCSPRGADFPIYLALRALRI